MSATRIGGSRVGSAAARAVRAAMEPGGGPRLADRVPPAVLDRFRADLRVMACECHTFEGFLARVILQLPEDARQDGGLVLAVARFAREVWHS